MESLSAKDQLNVCHRFAQKSSLEAAAGPEVSRRLFPPVLTITGRKVIDNSHSRPAMQGPEAMRTNEASAGD